MWRSVEHTSVTFSCWTKLTCSLHLKGVCACVRARVRVFVCVRVCVCVCVCWKASTKANNLGILFILVLFDGHTCALFRNGWHPTPPPPPPTHTHTPSLKHGALFVSIHLINTLLFVAQGGMGKVLWGKRNQGSVLVCAGGWCRRTAWWRNGKKSPLQDLGVVWFFAWINFAKCVNLGTLVLSCSKLRSVFFFRPCPNVGWDWRRRRGWQWRGRGNQRFGSNQ